MIKKMKNNCDFNLILQCIAFIKVQTPYYELMSFKKNMILIGCIDDGHCFKIKKFLSFKALLLEKDVVKRVQLGSGPFPRYLPCWVLILLSQIYSILLSTKFVPEKTELSPEKGVKNKDTH